MPEKPINNSTIARIAGNIAVGVIYLLERRSDLDLVPTHDWVVMRSISLARAIVAGVEQEQPLSASSAAAPAKEECLNPSPEVTVSTRPVAPVMSPSVPNGGDSGRLDFGVRYRLKRTDDTMERTPVGEEDDRNDFVRVCDIKIECRSSPARAEDEGQLSPT